VHCHIFLHYITLHGVVVQPSTAREMVMSVQKMEKDVETKRRKLNVSSIDEKNQKYLKQLKGWSQWQLYLLCLLVLQCFVLMVLSTGTVQPVNNPASTVPQSLLLGPT